MHPSIPRLVRVIPRSQVPNHVPTHAVHQQVRSDVKQPTLIELLMKRKEEAGDAYPPNIRIEPYLRARDLKQEHVPAEFGRELRRMMKER